MPDASEQSGGTSEGEYLRINAELAAELRRLTVAGAEAPHVAAAPAGRRIGRLLAERDSLSAELQASRAEVERLSRHAGELARKVHEQARYVEVLSQEVSRLRGGVGGVLRRLRARLLRRR